MPKKKLDPLPLPGLLPYFPKEGGSILVEQERLDALREEGSDCRCCGQRVQIYPRTVYASMVVWLIGLVRASEPTATGYSWVHVDAIPAKGGDYAKLRFWWLIEQHPEVPEGKKDSGLWRPTEWGVRFVHMDYVIFQHAYTYDNKVIGFGGASRNVTQALGKKFSYSELMGDARD